MRFPFLVYFERSEKPLHAYLQCQGVRPKTFSRKPSKKMFLGIRPEAATKSVGISRYARNKLQNQSSCNRMTIICRVTSGNKVFQLSFDVAQQSACSETEEFRLSPRVSQLFLHHRQPLG